MAKSGKTPKGGKKKTAPRTRSRTVAESRTAHAKKERRPAKARSASPKKRAVRVASPFSKEDLKHFRALLLTRRARILGNVESMEAEALKAADQDFSVDHMADHGSDNYEQDFTLKLVESERKELAEIHLALERMRQGSYGICEGTGLPIGRPRLEAIPYARYSVEYQRRLESGEVEEEEEEDHPPPVVMTKRGKAAQEEEADDDDEVEDEEDEEEEEDFVADEEEEDEDDDEDDGDDEEFEEFEEEDDDDDEEEEEDDRS